MATWLEEYTQIKSVAEQKIGSAQLTISEMLGYQEVLYRIEVLEACKMFSKTAPVTTEMKALVTHYQMVDAYLQCLSRERRIGMPADEQLKAIRKTASDSLEKILADCHRQFASFRPVNAESYRHDIQTVINMVLIGWLQLRNTYVDLKERKEHGHESK